ncbi:hypothetical protein SAMN05443287_112140 [Micromonospora phaseoli]|uniref:Uncharacterized protein n=1 Tax=Micromonospora phaseoli TaxID=1144548 RepID=A0A1H7DCC6_9ACTN|nr:hypothetical protein [Micromonospora phaseoli]PZV90918.1 hypothetical protein CLV64_112141 [Micromonospora phaseoli]GIJ77411.1 hypothetical protein Xph01_18430 [Micromonospora phaseoli]SEJ98557.1 hypothetical protein SAMN05443287_112140 [Micromonospora phaseoli]
MIRLRPGPPATPTDLRRAQELAGLLRGELDRVRAAALAWRNGLGGLLVALVGFSLIRGRSDVSTLAPGWGGLVGVLLLAAVTAGVAGAVALLRAAHGPLSVTPVATLAPAPLGEHREAVVAARALRVGVWLVLTCTILLIAAVGVTWYAPGRSDPSAGPASARPAGVVAETGGWSGADMRVAGPEFG